MRWPRGFSCQSLHWLYESFAAVEDYTTPFKPSSSTAKCYKNIRLGVWSVWGFLIVWCLVRDTDPVLHVLSHRSTNSSALKWQFEWGMLFYRGDKLQVSLVALGESFRARCQLSEWEPELWLTAAPDAAQSPRSAAVTSRRDTSPMKKNEAYNVPPTPHLIQWWWLWRKWVQPAVFFPSVSSFNEMMNDVLSPSRMATHTNLLPRIYTFTGSYVAHFSQTYHYFSLFFFL